MSISIFFSALILTTTIFHYVIPQSVLRQYVVKQQFFALESQGHWQCPSMTKGEKQASVPYWIELQPLAEIWKFCEYPSRKDVGRLKHGISKLLKYEGWSFGLWILKQIDGWKEPFEETLSGIGNSVQHSFQWWGISQWQLSSVGLQRKCWMKMNDY